KATIRFIRKRTTHGQLVYITSLPEKILIPFIMFLRMEWLPVISFRYLAVQFLISILISGFNIYKHEKNIILCFNCYNWLQRNIQPSCKLSGYGISCCGRIYQQYRNNYNKTIAYHKVERWK